MGGQVSHGRTVSFLAKPEHSQKAQQVVKEQGLQGLSCADAVADARLKQGFGNGNIEVSALCDLGAIPLTVLVSGTQAA